jgi:hypothetical protein
MIKGRYKATITFDFCYDPLSIGDHKPFEETKQVYDNEIDKQLKQFLISEFF